MNVESRIIKNSNSCISSRLFGTLKYLDDKIPFIFEFGARVLLIGFFDKFERENLTIKEPSICENKITDFSEARKNAG